MSASRGAPRHRIFLAPGRAGRRGRAGARRRAAGTRARLLHRRARKVRHDGAATKCCATTRRSSCRPQGAALLLVGPAREPAAAGRCRAAQTSRPTSSCSRRPSPDSSSARPRRSTSAPRRRRPDRADAPGRAHHRDLAASRPRFLRSFHMQAVRSRVETERDLRAALALDDARREGREIPNGTHVSWLMYAEHVRYVEQLRRFEDAFPPGARAGADLRRLPPRQRADAGARDCASSASRQMPLAPIETSNERPTGVRFMPLHRISRKLRMARAPPGPRRPVHAHRGASCRARCSGAWRRIVYEVRRRWMPALAAELHRRFRGEVEALGEHLDRDLIGLSGLRRRVSALSAAASAARRRAGSSRR